LCNQKIASPLIEYFRLKVEYLRSALRIYFIKDGAQRHP
jgi:hypothetical protein